jgi:TolB-like protein
MTEIPRAVFLSYASQDAGAARRICEALRAAGVEVWFDQSALRGGDAWDAAIRRQIKNCALFMPVISRNTHQREEGYFRLEWKLAVDRSHLMTTNRTFLLPIAIDDVGDDDEHVPDRFRELQWTRLPDGAATPEFVERVTRLLAHEDHGVPVPAPTPAAVGAAPLAAPVAGAAAAPTAPVLAPAQAPASSARPGWRNSHTLLVVIGVVVIALGYPIIQHLVQLRAPATTWPGAQPAVQPGAGAPGAIPQKSIAVLPFVNMSSDKDQEYFSDGLTEELIDLLSQVPDLRVPARTSSFYFKGKSEDIAAIAQKLRVAHVLEGSVRRSGQTMRVTAQLIRADDGYHLWSKAYDRDVKDIFKVQDEIAATVVDALKAKLLPAQELTGRHRTAKPEAYKQYLIGVQLRLRDTPATVPQALEAFRRAIAIDPGYAAAYSAVSEAEWRAGDMGVGDPASVERAADAADRAIALAPDSPEGYWARGQFRNYYYFDWAGAQSDYQKALALDPKFVPALIQQGDLQATLGHVNDGIETMHKALALDPMSVMAWRRLAHFYAHSRQFAAAREAVDRLQQLDPEGNRGRNVVDLDLLTGRAQEALTVGERDGSNFSFVIIAMAQHALGRPAESRQALDTLVQRASSSLAYQIAEVHAWRGEKDQAIDWLERAYQQHDGGMTYIAYDRYLDSLRGDARFRALLARLKLPTG